MNDDRIPIDGEAERARLIALGLLVPASQVVDHIADDLNRACLRLDDAGRAHAARTISKPDPNPEATLRKQAPPET